MRVLLVHEDPHEAEWIERTLGEAGLLSLLRLSSVGRVKEAIARFCPGEREPFPATSHGLPQLVLLDLKVEDGDPLDLVRCLRDDVRTRRIPVVAFGTSQRLIEDCYDAGVNSVLHKPEDPREFADTLRAAATYWTRFNEAPSG